MKLILTQNEIEHAVRKHIMETVQVREGTELTLDFSATRGTDGITVTVDIPYVGVSSLDLGAQQQKAQEPVASPAPETKPTKAAATKAPKAAPAGGLFATQPAAPAVAETSPIAADEPAAADTVGVEVADADEAAAVGAEGGTTSGASLFGVS